LKAETVVSAHKTTYEGMNRGITRILVALCGERPQEVDRLSGNERSARG
jgi:hypothetical protein